MIKSSITEFSNNQSVFPIVSLSGIGLSIESNQSLISADPKIILIVFQNAMYSIVLKQINPVMTVQIIPIKTKKSKTGS